MACSTRRSEWENRRDAPSRRGHRPRTAACVAARSPSPHCRLLLLTPAHAPILTPTHTTIQAEDLDFRQSPTFADCFPSSEKVFTTVTHNGHELHVPSRRVHLTNGSFFDLYDTSGPQVGG